MARAPCVPHDLPITDLDWRRLLPLAGRANAALARYDGMLQTLLNPAVLLSPITVSEAILSSRIEGTVATLEEVLQQEAGIEQDEGRFEDLEEVANYRVAMRDAEKELEHRPVSLSLIKGIHQQLLRGVRGEDKNPGRFRDDQNWIGRPGCKMEDARFIPPSPTVLTHALEQWASYVSSTDDDPVIQIAVVHAQFEILHPFKDGNGRIGRMLIPLILSQRGALSRPMFYLSEYLEENRERYYDALLNITEQGQWQNWIEFFLGAITVRADTNINKARKIIALYEQRKGLFRGATRSQFSTAALDAFFVRPMINATDFARIAGIENRVTANGILSQLWKGKLIRKVREGSGRTPAVYALAELINITEGRTVMPEMVAAPLA